MGTRKSWKIEQTKETSSNFQFQWKIKYGAKNGIALCGPASF